MYLMGAKKTFFFQGPKLPKIGPPIFVIVIRHGGHPHTLYPFLLLTCVLLTCLFAPSGRIPPGLCVRAFHQAAGQTALMLAARLGGSAPVVDALLAAGASPTLQDDLAQTALYHACSSPSSPLAVCRALLAAAPEALDLPNRDGATPLMTAAARGLAPHARHLLERGAQRQHRDIYGSSALHCAAEHGQADLVPLLTDCGEADMRMRTVAGHSPYQVCQQ